MGGRDRVSAAEQSRGTKTTSSGRVRRSHLDDLRRFARIVVSPVGYVFMSVVLSGCGSAPIFTDTDSLPTGIAADADHFEIVASRSAEDAMTWHFAVESTDSPLADRLQYLWDFGNGGVYLGVEQTYSFPSAGTYPVAVTALYEDDSTAFVLSTEVEIEGSEEVDDGPITAAEVEIDVSEKVNRGPIAAAGDDRTVEEGGWVELDGSESADPDGDSLKFSWVQIAGPHVLLNDSTNVIASFVAPDVDADVLLEFTLTVSDEALLHQDSIVIETVDRAEPEPVGGGGGGDPPGPVPCGTDADCADNVFCNGVETCSNGVCQVASPVDCDDGIACTIDSCDEGASSCDNVPDDGGCDNGTFCDGSETCHPLLGCQAGSDPCPAQLCDESTDTCTDIVCAANADCDDGLWCNGTETCVGNICQPGTSVDCDDGVPCTVDSCSEAMDSCQSVVTDALCDNGLFCDGSETCDSVLGCRAGSDPCPGEGCDEAGQSCVPPVLSVNPQALDFGCTGTDLVFDVWNSGGGTVSYTVSDNASWLAVSPSNGNSSGEHDQITATVDRNGLSNGSYQGVITVTWVETGSTVAALVTMLVGTCQPMTTASRTTGVAPLAVFFDAVDTTDPAWNSGVLQPGDGDYASFHYEWNFGDDPNATWSTNSKSKNQAIGYVAAHVFENPGTYPVMLTVTDTAGQTYDYGQVIQVDDPDVVFAGVKTRCVSTSGDFTGCPNGALQVTSSDFRDQMVWLFSSNGPARVLFKRGESFASTSRYLVTNRTGPYTIGAYGAGANPVIDSTHADFILEMRDGVDDVRIVDVDFDGRYPAETPGRALKTGTDVLVLRSHISHHNTGISNFGTRKDNNFFVDCFFQDNSAYGVLYDYGQHIAVMGCVFENVAFEHLLRTWITHSLIAHNIFRGGAAAKLQLKFIGFVPGQHPPLDEVEFCVISDNQFLDPGPVSWMITLGPQDSGHDERLHDLVFERNVLRASSSTQIALVLNNERVTIRNNTFDGTGTTWYRALAIFRRGIEPPPADHRIYNNTVYRNDAGVEFAFCKVYSDAQNTTIVNNLASAPLDPNPRMIEDLGSTGLVESNNLLTDTPGFVDAASHNVRLLGGSPAVGLGLTLPQVIEDFDSEWRGSPPDLGAFEFVP